MPSKKRLVNKSNSEKHIKNVQFKPLVAIDFFCSAGGVTCGFKQAGINVLGGIDIDKSCQITYEKNNDAKFLNKDVSNLDKNEIGKFFKIRRNQRNLIFVGCSPCQYYSNIQTDKSKSKNTRLLLEDFQDFVEYYRPGYVFIENVPGLDTKPGSPLEKFKIFLKENQYVFDEGVLNAKYFGVPQNRRRYVLIASRVKKKISLPKPDKTRITTVFDAIGDLNIFPPIEAGHKDPTPFKHSSADLRPVNLERISITEHDGGDRRSWPNELQPSCYENHDGHYDVYGRMFWNKPAPTITTKFASYSNGRYGHPEQNRAISLREGAVLQSFPMDYKFYSDSQGAIAKMIGNAVPPGLARNIGQSLLK
ncbi:DNA cytosine methyltransferase [Reichenbachiella sp.]|uniref:DNA cytosine methyltransferase n=1 Tax=Reichenbachiella sp. TaxID=2184521 RepID=UPI003298229A